MSTDSPNIVMVSIDSLRGDHCGFLGDDRGLTPTMDDLAAEGVAYETAVAPGPQTFSSMPPIFTGQPRPQTTLEDYPQESHWERRLASIDSHLRRNETLPERLQARGYDTAGVTPNPWTTAASGFDRGFDHFEDFSTCNKTNWPAAVAERLPGVDTDSRAVQLVINMAAGSEFFAPWERLHTEIKRLRRQLSEPYFLWVFVLDTHFPFIPKRRHREEQSLFGTYYSAYRSSEPMRGNGEGMSERVRQSLQRSYRDTVRATDTFLRELRLELAADDPVMLVHSDHGESFGDHGNYGHHHRQVYEENIHVPYLVHNAGSSETVSAPTSLMTIPETAVTIAEEGSFDPAAGTDRQALAASECGTHRAVRRDRYKYVASDGDRELFDLQTDPGEADNIAPSFPELSRRLDRQLQRRDHHIAESTNIHRTVNRLVANRTL
ncbi:sulfatase-like hydrolase/transferase [Halonotius terrestris]|nr:sulfatase [Halonotius terrestris]